MARENLSMGRIRRSLTAALSALVLLSSAAPALAAKYDEDQAMNPIQIIALAATPVGVALRWIVVKPIWWLGQREPLKTLFDVGD